MQCFVESKLEIKDTRMVMKDKPFFARTFFAFCSIFCLFCSRVSRRGGEGASAVGERVRGQQTAATQEGPIYGGEVSSSPVRCA